MRYDIIITAIRNPRAKMVLAHRMAQDPSMPLQKALAALESMPAAYLHDIPEVEAAQALAQLKRLEVDARIISKPQPGVPAEGGRRTPPLPQIRQSAAQPRKRPPLAAFVGAAPPKARRAPVAAALAVIAALMLTLAGLAVFTRHRGVSKTEEPLAIGIATAGPGAQSPREAAGSGSDFAPAAYPGEPMPYGRAGVSAAQRANSQRLADSARASASLPSAIRFYQAAIAFNKRNLDAWHGLVNAYRDAGMSAQAAQAESDLQRIFGAKAASVVAALAAFGVPHDVSYDEEGTLRMEYVSKSSGEDALVKETYRLMRSARAACGCHALSLRARTTAGEDMAVYLDTPQFPVSLEAYRAAARITYLQ